MPFLVETASPWTSGYGNTGPFGSPLVSTIAEGSHDHVVSLGGVPTTGTSCAGQEVSSAVRIPQCEAFTAYADSI